MREGQIEPFPTGGHGDALRRCADCAERSPRVRRHFGGCRTPWSRARWGATTKGALGLTTPACAGIFLSDHRSRVTWVSPWSQEPRFETRLLAFVPRFVASSRSIPETGSPESWASSS